MVITTTDIQLFQILRQKLGEQEAEALVSFVDGKIKDNNEVNLKVLATKEDISLLKLDISNLKSEILKWMVGLFIPLYLTIVGLIITMLLKH
ncbi:MAG: hypothetical protein WCP65_07270 [Bacteroidota bacterium]